MTGQVNYFIVSLFFQKCNATTGCSYTPYQGRLGLLRDSCFPFSLLDSSLSAGCASGWHDKGLGSGGMGSERRRASFLAGSEVSSTGMRGFRRRRQGARFPRGRLGDGSGVALSRRRYEEEKAKGTNLKVKMEGDSGCSYMWV